jgi:hypothetical protein
MIGWEPRDIPARAPALAIAGVFVLGAVSASTVGGALILFAQHRPPDRASALQQGPQVPPAPRLQVRPRNDLAAVQAVAAARLSRPAAKPLDQAMREEAARGWTGEAGR